MKFIRPNTITDAGGTYTRAAGTATYFNSSGVLTLGSTNVPRENYVYDETTSQWRLDGVLIESSKTNLILRSQEFDNASWTKNNCVVTANTAVAPDGTSTADTITSSNTGNDFISQIPTIANSTLSTYSLYVKNINSTASRLMVRTTVTAAHCVFNWSGSTLISITNSVTPIAEPTFENCGNGWYRISVYVATTEANQSFRYYPDDSGTGKSTYAWGAQLETGILTSYIPTTTATVTRPADTITGTGMVYSSIAETDHAAWVSGTTYAVGDRVIRTTTTTHKIYERVVAGAGTTAPESDVINWIAVSPTNRWKLFDESPSTITTAATETMSYILKPGRSNSFSALEVDATEISINVYISGERVYSGYTNMLNNENVGNWYEYFYEPFYYQTSLAITDLLNAANLELPSSNDMVVTITLRKASSTPSLGAAVLGIVYELGKTQNGMNLSIIDYSRKETNDYGNTILVRRKFSKRLSATFFLYSSKVDVVSNLLTQYRATPVVWIGADNNYNSLVIYGFYRDWNIGIPNNIGSTCNIEIEGLA